MKAGYGKGVVTLQKHNLTDPCGRILLCIDGGGGHIHLQR